MNRVFLFVSVAVILISSNLVSQWSSDSTLNTPVSVASGDQFNQREISDGSGGIIMAWEDYRPGATSDIYAQRIDGSGIVKWTTDGAAICSASGYQQQPAIASDGVGGAFIAWWDRRNEGPDGIFVQRINASGVVQWTANGINICAQTVDLPSIASDGNGGAIVAWEDNRNSGTKIYSQRIDGSGGTHWTTDGIAISTATGSQLTPIVISDGVGGAIIGFAIANAGNFELHAQRVNSSGTVKWGAAGTSICTAANNSLTLFPAMIADGYGGALFAWEDDRNTTDNDIYAQRVDSSGNVRWTSNGVAICSTVRDQRSASLASDGKGGAVIAWRDERRSIIKSDIYVQQIDSSGAVQWASNGIAICVTSNTEYLPKVLGDGTGGGIVVWQDRRTGSADDIYAQRIDATGTPVWNANGIAVCAAAQSQENPIIVSDGSGGAIVSWDDFRVGNTFRDLYAQHVSTNSVLPVELNSFFAKPAKMFVTLEWTTASEVNNYGFEVQRFSMNNHQLSLSSWNRVGFIEGAGSSNRPNDYSFVDKGVMEGAYSYRLKQIDRDGAFRYSQKIEVEVTGAPSEFALGQNYPNPFNPTTNIQFTISDLQFVELKVYDVLGREVATLVVGEKAPGNYSVKWDAAGFPSGIYIYRLRAGNFVESKKMILMK